MKNLKSKLLYVGVGLLLATVSFSLMALSPFSSQGPPGIPDRPPIFLPFPKMAVTAVCCGTTEIVYVTRMNKVYRSIDGGESWVDVTPPEEVIAPTGEQ